MQAPRQSETTYCKGRFIYDADSHIVEWSTWLRDYADPAIRERVPLLWRAADYPHLVREVELDPDAVGDAVDAELNRVHESSAFREKALQNVMLQKQLNAFGGFRGRDRSMALDQMGFRAQMVFNTFANQVLQETEATGDLPLIRGMVRAHNRAIVDFCRQDPRLIAVGYVPLSDPQEAAQISEEAIKSGCRALIVASACPPGHSPTHAALDGVWARAAEAKTPIAMHVGGTAEVLNPAYKNNGRERTPDFHGGEGSMTSLRVLALPNPAKALISAMVMDGVLMQHPDLKIGVFELGASWYPSLLREIDAIARGFKSEPRITRLDLLPSEFILRQVWATPYPYEDISWIMSQGGEQACMFSSDFPHHEGGRDPISRFDAWLKDASETRRSNFYVNNFARFIGGGLPGGRADIAA